MSLGAAVQLPSGRQAPQGQLPRGSRMVALILYAIRDWRSRAASIWHTGLVTPGLSLAAIEWAVEQGHEAVEASSGLRASRDRFTEGWLRSLCPVFARQRLSGED